jgi:hypothetical protein
VADLENLRAFIRTLVDTIEDVGESQPGLVAQGEALGTLHEDAEEELGGLESELGAALTALDTQADGAEDALGGLDNAAKAGDTGVLQDSTNAFDEWEKTLGTTLDEAAALVGRESGELAGAGFEALTSALTEAVSEVDGMEDATEAAFDTLIAQLEHQGQRFTQALAAATAAAGAAAEQGGELEKAFNAKSTEAIEAIQSSSGAAASAHGETSSGAGTFYDSVDERIRTEVQDLASDVKTAFEQAAAAVREAAEQPLEEPVDMLLSDALDPFVEEIASWAGQEQTTEQALANWDTLVKDLAAAIEVIKRIDAADEAVG